MFFSAPDYDRAETALLHTEIFFDFRHNTKVLIPHLYIKKEIPKISTIVLYIIDLNNIILSSGFGSR